MLTLCRANHLDAVTYHLLKMYWKSTFQDDGWFILRNPWQQMLSVCREVIWCQNANSCLFSCSIALSFKQKRLEPFRYVMEERLASGPPDQRRIFLSAVGTSTSGRCRNVLLINGPKILILQQNAELEKRIARYIEKVNATAHLTDDIDGRM